MYTLGVIVLVVMGTLGVLFALNMIALFVVMCTVTVEALWDATESILKDACRMTQCLGRWLKNCRVKN